jgi:hypothetical protein
MNRIENGDGDTHERYGVAPLVVAEVMAEDATLIGDLRRVVR